jgi:hypothetical protein
LAIQLLLAVERREGIAMLQGAQEWAFDEDTRHKNKGWFTCSNYQPEIECHYCTTNLMETNTALELLLKGKMLRAESVFK